MNQTYANEQIGMLFAFKTTAKAGGWTVTRSGDGASLSSLTGDILTNQADTGAVEGSLYNTDAWFVLQDPDGNREYCFQCRGFGVGPYSWRVIYSRAAGFTGGGDAARATATDEEGLFKDNTAYQNLWEAGGGARYCYGLTSSAINGEWGWFMYQNDPVTAASEGCYQAIPLINVLADHADPIIFYGEVGLQQASDLYGNASCFGHYNPGGGAENWENVSLNHDYAEGGLYLEGDHRPDVDASAYQMQMLTAYQGDGVAGRRYRLGNVYGVLWEPDDSVDEDDLYEDQDGNVWRCLDAGAGPSYLMPWPDNTTAPLPDEGAGGFSVFDMIVWGADDFGGTTTYYRNRVWDTESGASGNFVRWSTTTVDSAGASYPGPGAFGVDTSDYVVELEYIA